MPDQSGHGTGGPLNGVDTILMGPASGTANTLFFLMIQCILGIRFRDCPVTADTTAQP